MSRRSSTSRTLKTLQSLHQIDERLRAGDELSPLLAAMEGRYVRPGPGGDPVRSPEVLPSGRNIHALDPARVPCASAMRQAQATVDTLLASRRASLGDWPRSIGLVLWGLDSIKNQAESVAQAFCLLGVRPALNSIGRISGVDILSLEELGRHRIDVVLTASGIFRDIFGLQLELLDDAIRQVASLNEPEDMNFVRRRCRELEEGGLSSDDAATRVFSNAPGAYGTNVDHMVNLSSWEERSDLARVYTERKGFAYRSGRDAEAAPALLRRLAGGIDTTFQNIDSVEVSLTDVDHYFEYLGGLGALVESERGQRPDALVADATQGHLRLSSLEDAVALESRTKLLNPRWYEALLAHGYEGVEEIKKRLDYTFGWSATSEAVADWVYREAQHVFVDDEDVSERMRAANPHAFDAMLGRLKEAADRGFWEPSEEERERLEDLSAELEDEIEGVT